MNLLLIQDALKNASDQQLAQMMQSPDSSAPSYLVLSEIRRRKDMRRQQPQVSNRTVADDLTAPEDQGIRGLQPAMGQPQEQAPQEVDDQAGIEAMREGGVVRMQEGGQPPSRPLSEMSPAEVRRYASGRLPGYSASEARLELFRRGIEPFFLGEFEQNRPRPYLGYGDGEEEALSSGAVPPLQVDRQPQAAAPSTSPLRGMTENYGEGVPSFAPPAAPAPGATQAPAGGEAEPTQAQPAQAAATPSPGRAAPAGGGGGGMPSAPASSGGGQSLRDIFRRNEGLFPDSISALRNRAQEDRIDPAARRNEALNMALIEAGLRIASSRNPNLIGAIGEGALPAVQSYGQQVDRMRQEQRQARQDELDMAKYEIERQFRVGQISVAEYNALMREAGENRRLAASLSAQGAATSRAIAAQEAQTARAIAAQEAQTQRTVIASLPTAIGNINNTIRNLQTQLGPLGPKPPETIQTNPIFGSRQTIRNPAYETWVAGGGLELSNQIRALQEQRSLYEQQYRSAFPAQPGQQTQSQTPAQTESPRGTVDRSGSMPTYVRPGD